MGLVSLVLLLAMTVLYLEKHFEKKPEAVVKVLSYLHDYEDKITLWGCAYSFLCLVLTPAMTYSMVGALVRILANMVIIFMTLPFIFEKYSEVMAAKTNPVFIRELAKTVAWVTKQEKIIGYFASAVSVLLFAILFK